MGLGSGVFLDHQVEVFAEGGCNPPVVRGMVVE